MTSTIRFFKDIKGFQRVLDHIPLKVIDFVLFNLESISLDRFAYETRLKFYSMKKTIGLNMDNSKTTTCPKNFY